MAEQGRLRTPAALRQQVRRMLADPKSEAMVTNFAGQWLYLRNLKNMVPLSTEFVDFDDNLRRAFAREAELFFASVMRENRSVLDLMTADYTFVNERLAKHYGIPEVYGSHFRRVTLADDARRGILGKGAVLMVTSHTDRTSPVVRGKWVLDQLLGAPPPPMPANVPPLDESAQQAGRVLTMRERMEAHRRNPVCANCHKIMDPIGLALENFDAVGAWRSVEGGTHGTADRRLGRAARRHEGGRRGVAAAGAPARPGDLRRHRGREADDLRPRPRRRRRRHADRARNRARHVAAAVPVRLARRRHRQQPGFPDAARIGRSKAWTGCPVAAAR